MSDELTTEDIITLLQLVLRDNRARAAMRCIERVIRDADYDPDHDD